MSFARSHVADGQERLAYQRRHIRSARIWLRWLVGVVFVECAIAAYFRLGYWMPSVHVDGHAGEAISLLGLTWLAVVATVACGALRALRRTPARPGGDHTMTAVGGTCHEWLWEADADLRLTYSSPAAFTLLGYTPEQLVGQTIPSLLGANGDQCCRRMLAAALATQSGWHDKVARWRHADGYLVELQGSAVPIVNDIGEVVGFRGSRRAANSSINLTQAQATAHDRLTQALADRSFDIALQPIVDVTRGRLVGAEALAKFRDGRSPDRWFSEARMTGQSLDLERATFFAALAKLGHLPTGCYLSVNASPELVTDPEFIDCLTYGSAPLDRLVVEITEHVAIAAYDDLRECLAPLRRRGLLVAVDDTGAGYASFSHVLQLRPNIIKIDRSIISCLADDPARRSLVTAMVVLALELDASVTAEGVESSAELNTLASLAVDHAQGYFLARPTTDPVEWASWRGFAWLTPRELAGIAV